MNSKYLRDVTAEVINYFDDLDHYEMTFQEKIESAIFMYESLKAKENIEYFINEIKEASKCLDSIDTAMWLIGRLEEVKEAD